MLGLFLYPVHDFLDVGRRPEPADCVFAHAGRPERKAFALQLYSEGFAPRAVLSVGRFEWRSVLKLGLAEDGGLARLAEQVPPERRHFFVSIAAGRVESRAVPRAKLGTLGEARALARLLREGDCRSVLLVSSAFHLRRAVSSLRRSAKGYPLKIVPVAVPEPLAREKRENWWKNASSARLIVGEYVKAGFYPLGARLGF
jgi:uncharacterized SAM-binding protein YcdF (DUF218 family)